MIKSTTHNNQKGDNYKKKMPLSIEYFVTAQSHLNNYEHKLINLIKDKVYSLKLLTSLLGIKTMTLKIIRFQSVSSSYNVTYKKSKKLKICRQPLNHET